MAVKCVHQSCGKKYTDPEEECNYHPGPPNFHEGQKGWSCCKPRVLTFDEFLSIPPCTSGKHSTTDHPPTVPKNTSKPTSDAPSYKPISSTSTPSRAPIAAPPSPNTPPPPPPESSSDEASIPVPVGKACRRKACGAQYKGGAREDEKCVYHPGVPVFHEGNKGYTCCKKRVLEFDEFMRLEGCKQKGRHLFIGSGKKKVGQGQGIGEVGEDKVESIRHDFYQTATTVIASFFLKKIDKTKASVVFSSQQELALDLPTTDTPPKRYKAKVPLYGTIDTDASSFTIMGTKLEVTFIKADGSSWPVLRSDEQRTGEIIQVGKAGRA